MKGPRKSKNRVGIKKKTPNFGGRGNGPIGPMINSLDKTHGQDRKTREVVSRLGPPSPVSHYVRKSAPPKSSRRPVVPNRTLPLEQN